MCSRNLYKLPNKIKINNTINKNNNKIPDHNINVQKHIYRKKREKKEKNDS